MEFNRSTMNEYDSAFLNTPLGTAKIVGNKNGIVEISILDDHYNTTEEPSIHLKNCMKQLEQYFSGERTVFSVKLNPKGTDFQKKVWAELLHIPFGKRISYMKQTLLLGDKKAIRAVAAIPITTE